MACKCGSHSTLRDDVTGNLVCSSCYTVLDFDNYDAQIYGLNGPTGTNIRFGRSGTDSDFSYKERKIYNAEKSIHQYTVHLNITHKESAVVSMISEITEREFGEGDWFHVLIGACCYVVMRRDNKFLPAAEVAEAVGCDIYELGKMIARVVKFLKLSLPEVSVAGLFERELSNCARLDDVDEDKKERMKKQGIFLINCSVKWFLTTGRRPMPVVAAVMALVAELNGVEGFKLEDVAKDVRAAVATCKLRYKELLEALVKVAQVLPWGKDVTVKNVIKYAPFVIRYMEIKSMQQPGGGGGELVGNFDIDDVVSECLRKVSVYGDDENNFVDGDYQFFEGKQDDNGIDNFKLSHECLSMVYTKSFDEVDDDDDYGEVNRQRGNVIYGRQSRGLEFEEYSDWWSGKSELSKRVLLERILEKEIGLDLMPPSFIAGRKANERRRKKIDAAKMRINKVWNPSNTCSDNSEDTCSSKVDSAGKKRKRRQAACQLDWEDFVIETLLLHQVKEEDIEKGHYKALLGLHVFGSGMV